MLRARREGLLEGNSRQVQSRLKAGEKQAEEKKICACIKGFIGLL